MIYHTSFPDEFLSLASRKVTQFTRAMPESIKFDTTIDTITAYKQYLNTKPWLASNYLRIPSRKPSFIITTMTTSTPNKSDLPVYDFSDDNKIAKALNDAPAVQAMKTKGLVPAPKKAATKKSGKAGRIVGISKDENEYIQEVLIMIADDPELGYGNPNYVKIQARYNK